MTIWLGKYKSDPYSYPVFTGGTGTEFLDLKLHVVKWVHRVKNVEYILRPGLGLVEIPLFGVLRPGFKL